jgi:hypothetical protein
MIELDGESAQEDYHYIDVPSWISLSLVRETKSPSDVKMVVRRFGNNYKVGDRFKVQGSDALLEVASVEEREVPQEGGVTNILYTYTGVPAMLKVINRGTYLDTNKLLPSGSPDGAEVEVNRIKSYTQSTAKVVPLNSTSVNGKGFNAYVVRGVVRQITDTDAKPKIGTTEDMYQLSMPADNSPGKWDGSFIPVSQGGQTIQADLDPDSATINGMYDLFFHFHNDVSHTWMTNDFGIFANHRDQFIDLTITPV